jgi:putative component of toxin-antitoxin plasmid stabilization module
MRFKKIAIRLYYFEAAKAICWLLVGGDKTTQIEDIKKAKAMKPEIERKIKQDNERNAKC